MKRRLRKPVTRHRMRSTCRRRTLERLEDRMVLSASTGWGLDAVEFPLIAETPIGFSADQLQVDTAAAEIPDYSDLFEGVVSLLVSELPALDSNPGAPVDIFLDLDGHYEPTWGAYSNALTPVYDIDGDFTTFNDTELSRIYTAWQMVSEDFAPFNVNVTTVEPAVLAEGVPTDQANGDALRIAIGGSWEDWYGGSAGGVGYINSFTSSIPNVVYVFSDNTSSLFGETSSHEAGHGFGLYHQSAYNAGGDKVEEYYSGTSTWQPIMGGGTTSLSITSTWYDGTNSEGANVYQDDMAVIAGAQNGFGFRADDHGDAIGSSSSLSFDGVNWTAGGIIETNNDVDVFRFSPTSGGDHALRVDPAEVAPNLDAVLELRNSGGALIATAAPADDLAAQLVADLPAGEDYYLHVTKTSTYGYVGHYSVTALEIAPGPRIIATAVDEAIDGELDSIRITFAEPIDASTFGVDDVQLTDQAGEVTVTGIATVAGSGDTQFDIQFATLSTAGFYDLAIAPTIADAGGNMMNQDQDEFAGEPIDDGYARRFTITAPGSLFLVTSSQGGVYARDLEVAADGYIYMIGVVSTGGTADFDPGPAVTTLTSQAYSDSFVAKYTPAHDLVWVSQMSSDGNLFAYEMELDSSQNVYVTGYFSLSSEPATATFGPFTVSAQESSDPFLAKLNSDGDFVWAESWGGAGSDIGYSVSLTSDDAVHVGGYFRETIDFDPSSGTSTATSVEDSADGYIVRFDSDGNFVSATTFDGPGSDYVRDLASDEQGNLFAVGNFLETIQLGPAHSLVSAGSSDTYVAKLSADHQVQWIRHVSGTSSVSLPETAVDGSGNVYLMAYFSETVDFGVGTPTFTNSGGSDSLVAKWDSTGEFQWARQIDGGEETIRLTTVDLDSQDNVYLSGYFSGTVDLGAGTEVVNLTSRDGQDDFLLGLDANGDFRFVHQVEREGSGFIRAMRVGPRGNLYLGGDFEGSVVLPTGDQYTNEEDGRDLYLLKLNLAPGITVSPLLNLTTTEAGGSASFDVVLDTQPTSDVTIALSSSDVGEGMALPSSLTFTPANWNMPQTVMVAGVDDGLLDGDIAYFILTAPANSSDLGYDGLDAVDVSVTNLDNDQPIVLFADSFENGQWSGLWVEDSQNDWFTSSQRASLGTTAAEVDGYANSATLTMANPVDLTPYGSVELSFSWYIEGTFDTNEYVALDILVDGTWQNGVAMLRGNVDQENTWHHESIQLDGSYLVDDFSLRFRAQASRSNEDANVDNVQLVATSFVGPPNELPSAVPGGPYTGAEGSSVTFDGSASFDPDGTITGYDWDFDNDGQYDDATGATPSFYSNEDGVFPIGLQVTDGGGDTATATTTVTISNVGPTANAGGPYAGSEGSGVTLNASASSDPGLDIASYAWDFDNDGAFDDASGVNVTFNPANEGSFPIGLIVTDNDGASSIASTTVNVTNVAPVADAGGPYAGEANVAVTMAGSALDPGDDVLTYEWDFDYDGSTFNFDSSGEDLTSPSHVYASGGSYLVALRVSDGTDTSAIVTSTVNISERPVAEANGSYSSSEGTAIAFSAAGSDDPDGSIVAYYWDFGDGTFGSGASPSHMYADNGTYTVMLTVTDNAGLTATDTAAATISNVAPTASVGSSYTGEEGVPITFAGSATDPGNDSLTFYWDFEYDGSFAAHVSGATLTSPSHTYSTAGTYSVALQVIDDDGGESLISTATVSVAEAPPQPADVLYFSLNNSGTVGSIVVQNEDILALEADGDVRLVFDGTDVGLSGLKLDAFDFISDTEVLLSFKAAGSVADVGSFDDSDVLLFSATSLGDNTAGSFSMYFDGSDVGLTANGEDIDAVFLLDDGRLVISTTGSPSVPGVSGDRDEDLLVFAPTSLGPTTAGSWAMYFDGSDVGLATSSSEDVNAMTMDGAGNIYLSTTGNFAVSGVSGADEDVFVFAPTSLGTITAGSFSSTFFFDGSDLGLGANDVLGIDLPAPSGPAPAQAPTIDPLEIVSETEPTLERPRVLTRKLEQAFDSIAFDRSSALLTHLNRSRSEISDSADGPLLKTQAEGELKAVDLAIDAVFAGGF